MLMWTPAVRPRVSALLAYETDALACIQQVHHYYAVGACACVRIDQSGLCKCFQRAQYNGCSETMPATSLPLEWWFIIIFSRALQIAGRHWEMHEDFSRTALASHSVPKARLCSHLTTLISPYVFGPVFVFPLILIHFISVTGFYPRPARENNMSTFVTYTRTWSLYSLTLLLVYSWRLCVPKYVTELVLCGCCHEWKKQTGKCIYIYKCVRGSRASVRGKRKRREVLKRWQESSLRNQYLHQVVTRSIWDMY